MSIDCALDSLVYLAGFRWKWDLFNILIKQRTQGNGSVAVPWLRCIFDRFLFRNILQQVFPGIENVIATAAAGLAIGSVELGLTDFK